MIIWSLVSVLNMPRTLNGKSFSVCRPKVPKLVLIWATQCPYVLITQVLAARCSNHHVSSYLYVEPIFPHTLTQSDTSGSRDEVAKTATKTHRIIQSFAVCSILRGAEIRLRSTVIILRRGVVVTVVMVVVVVVVLRGGVVVVMVMVVTLDVSVGEEEGGRWRRRLLGRRHARRQSPGPLDGAVPGRGTQLGCGGQQAGPITPTVDASGQVIITIIPSGVIKEISSGAEAVAVDHPSWSQVLVGSLDSEENHH